MFVSSKYCRALIVSKNVQTANLIHALSASTTSKASPHESKSFCMNLFRGRVVFDQAFPYPLNLGNDQHETLNMVMKSLKQYLEEVNDPFKNDETASIPMEQLKQFADLGAFGILVPESYEGGGMDNTQMARLAEEIGKHDLGLGAILLYGTESQKQKYLPDLATGRKFAAFCLTEPSSGSDAQSIRTRAVKSDCGKYYILNGGKIWISNGGFADVFSVFAQTPIKQADGTTKDKISAFIVERAFGGVTNGPPEKKMGIKGSNTAEVHFENVKVPVENLVGEEGEGFKVAMNVLNNGRFGIPAACTGAMKYCLQKTIDHVTTRVQFGNKIMEYGNVQEKVSDMVQRIYATESILYMLSSNMDRGVMDYQIEAAIAKVMASDNAWHVCDEAIQLHGGMGFMRETGLERVLRDLRIFRIFEGSNPVMKLFVALTGMQYAGKHLAHMAKEIKSGGISTLISEFKRRAFGDSGSDFSAVVHPSLKECTSLLNADVATFGRSVEALLAKHRKDIIHRQYELIRIADAAIDIYSVVAVLSRATYALNHNHEGSDHDLQIAQLFSRGASQRIRRNLAAASNPNGKDLQQIEEIARTLYKSGGLVHRHPLDL